MTALREYNVHINGVASTKELVKALRAGLVHEDVLTTKCLRRELAHATERKRSVGEEESIEDGGRLGGKAEVE